MKQQTLHHAKELVAREKLAKVGCIKRNLAMRHVIAFLSYLTLRFTNRLLKNDGFSFGQRM